MNGIIYYDKANCVTRTQKYDESTFSLFSVIFHFFYSYTKNHISVIM